MVVDEHLQDTGAPLARHLHDRAGVGLLLARLSVHADARRRLGRNADARRRLGREELGGGEYPKSFLEQV